MDLTRAIRAALLVVLLPGVVLAQAPPATQSAALTSTSCPGTGCTQLTVAGYGSVAVQLTGFGTATAQFEGSIDGATFVPVNMTPTNASTPVTSATANGIWLGAAAGLKLLRVRLSAYTSGTIAVTVQAAFSGGSSGGGGGGGGSAPSGTIGAAVPATASPVAAQDASGNLAYFKFDGSGNLLTAVTGAGSGGTSSVDGAAYTASTTAGTPLMVARDDTGPTALAEDKVGIARGDTNRDVYTVIRDAGLNQRGANVTAAGALQTDGSGVTQPVNTAQIAGTTTATGNGVVGAGVQRVAIASDNTAFTVNPGNTANTTPWLVDVNKYGGTATTLGQKTMTASVPVVLPSDQFLADTSATLQNAAVANANGTELTATSLASAVLTANCASCSGGTTINFEGREDASNFTSLQCQQLGTNTIATTTTTAGVTVWQCPLGGLQALRARISAYSAGTVTITGHAIAGDHSPKVTNVNLVGSLPAGTAVIGHVIADSGSTTAVTQATAANLNATVVQGNAGSNAQAWWTQIGDTTTGPVAVKAASTAAVATDKAVVVAVSPNNTIAATQSGPWNVTNISGTVSLPTGAATETTLATRLADATYTGRMPAGASPADAESNTLTSLSRIGAFPYVYNGTTWDRLRGDTTNGAFVNVKTSVLPTGAATEATLATRLADATYTGRMPAGASPADNESNTNTALSRIGNYNYLFDGTTWDRWPGDSANGGKVQVAAALPTGGNTIGAVTQASGPWTVTGTLTNNTAPPSTNNLGVLVARATASAPSYTEGNMVTLSTDNAGALRVSGSSGGGVAQMQVRDLANNWQDVGYQRSNAQLPVYDTVSYQTLQQLLILLQQQNGYLRGTFGSRIGSVNDALKVYPITPQDPCSGTTKGNVAISQTATSKLVAGIPGLRIFVCAARVVAGVAEIVNFTEGTGTTCGTGETAVAGSTTTANGESYLANGGFGEAAAAAIMLTNKAGDDLCLKQNGANRLAGNLIYAYVP